MAQRLGDVVELVLKLFWPWVRGRRGVDTQHSGSAGSCVDGGFEASKRAVQSLRALPGLV